MSEIEEVIGTVEPTNQFDRTNETLWIQPKHSRNRHFCQRCKRGEHSEGFDNPCNDKCECLCKTHYIGQDGMTRIPYGMLDTSKSDEHGVILKHDPNIDAINEAFRNRKK